MKSGSRLSPSVRETASHEAETRADVSGRNARVLNAHVVEPRNSCIAAAIDFLSRKPGIVERAIQARLSAGLEPTKANLRAAVGTASATKEERGANLYETPPEAMFTLLALEEFTACVLEPACGRGAISRMLEAHHYGVVLADINDYGTADSNGELQAVQDFLTSQPLEAGSYDIVTNPPYGDVLNAFVAHALRVYQPRKMALLLNLNFLCGFADDDRNFVMDDCPPARVYVFKRRLPMMHRDGWEGNKASRAGASPPASPTLRSGDRGHHR